MFTPVFFVCVLSPIVAASAGTHGTTGFSLVQTRLDAQKRLRDDPKPPHQVVEPLHVVVISDRAQALLGSLGSLMLYTTHPTMAHVISRNENLENELALLTGNAMSIVRIEIIPFKSVLLDLKKQGIVPVWDWPEFGRSISDPNGWLQNHSVRVDKWDNLTVHSNPMNLLRFYLPELRQFQHLPNILFMDDDIIVKGDLATLSHMSPAEGQVQLATCGIWKWGGGTNGQCESFSLHDTMRLSDTDFMYMNGKTKQSPLYKESLEAAIETVNGEKPKWQSVKYWNYGFVLMNLTEWRRVNMSATFVSWFRTNYERHIFPEYSLSYGLGLAQLMLMGKVQCWDDMNISIADGLGYVTSEDFDRSNISLNTLETSFVLHWSGTEKPFVESPSQSFRSHWNSVLKALHVPQIQEIVPKPRRKALLVTDTPSGSEWFLDLLDQHPRVCAAKGGTDAFPRESLITGDLNNLGINYCSRAVSCTWSFISQWVPVFYKFKDQYCGSNAETALWNIQFPNAADVYRLNRARLCSWVDLFHAENVSMNPQSLFDMYTRIAFGAKSRNMLGCTCPPSKDIQLLKFVSDWWVGEQQKVEHFDHRLFDLPEPQFMNKSRTRVRQDFRYRDGYLNRLHSPELAINFSDFTIVSFSRENIFEQYVSSELESVALKFPERAGKPINIHINSMLHYIDDAVRLRQSFFKALERLSSRVLYLTYEQCVNDPRSCSDRVQTYMGLEHQPLEMSSFISSLKDEDVLANVANAGAVRQALQEYGLARWIKSQSSSTGNGRQFARPEEKPLELAGDMRAQFLVPSVEFRYKQLDSFEREPSYWWDGNSDRLIFLHMHRTGGSTLTEVLGGKEFPTVNMSGKLIPRHTLRQRFPCLPDATCKIQNFAADVSDGPDKESCWNEWPGSTAHYIHRLHEIQETNCRLVELHHFDITGAMPFVRNGFKVITIIREPVSHLGSRFEYELLRRWNYTGDLEGESYNSTFAKFAKWTEFQTSPQQALRYLTGCAESRLSDPQFDFMQEEIEQMSPGLCKYEYLDGFAKFPVVPNTASSMIQMAVKVAREKVATMLLFEAWTQSLELASKKHAYHLFKEDLHLNAVGSKQFDFSMLPVDRQRHLRARLLPDTQLYNLMTARFADDATRYNVDLSEWYSDCECTEFRFGVQPGNVSCENKVSEVGSHAKVCMPARTDGTCELDQVMCMAKTTPAPPADKPVVNHVAQWEHAVLNKLVGVFKALLAYLPWLQSAGPTQQPLSVPTETSASLLQIQYTYELRHDMYCGGTRTRALVGPESWSIDDALDTCDSVEGCLCVSMHHSDNSGWVLSIFESPDEKQAAEMDSFLLNPSAKTVCDGAQEFVAGTSRCFLRLNNDWTTYRKKV